MYENFFGLKERPFDLAPNPRFLYVTGPQREALSNLRYGLTTPRGLTLLLGEAGTGKTTLVQAVLAELESDSIECVMVSNPTLTRDEFYEYLSKAFGLDPSTGSSKTRFLFAFRRHLEERHRAGKLSALIMDEAQSVPYDLLEEVRLLSNIETPAAKLLNVVLAGQPELADRLNEASLRQLKQRISLRCELRPLDFPETAAYIAGRIRIAGGKPADIFSREAVAAIHDASAGVPRTINVVCDNTLIGGFAAEVKPVTRALVQEVMRDFDLGGGGGSAPEPAAAADRWQADAPRDPAETPDTTQERRAAAGAALRSAPLDAGARGAGATAAAPAGSAPPESGAAPIFGAFTRRRRFSFF
jgi:general secretion pathway protein A